MNRLGRDHAAGRMVPADQRLEARQLLGLGVDHRLVVRAGARRAPIAFLRSFSSICRSCASRVHLGREEAEGAAAGRLGRIEREVGVADQGVGAGSRRGGAMAMPTEAPIEILWPSII